jgi:hypothetical protein
MNSIFENRNIDTNAEKRLSPFRCPECAYVGTHKAECVYRSAYVATGNPYVWEGFNGLTQQEIQTLILDRKKVSK